MKRFQELFKKIVDVIEGNTLPLKRYLFLFLAILSVRLCLEFFSNQRLFRAEDAIHIGLWFMFIVGAFMIQLHLFSGEKIEKIVRLVVCCFSIALTAPIIDLIVSQGKLSKMNYLAINSVSDIAYSYITIGGASLSRGATLGIRIEIVLLVFASFNYVYAKTGKIFKSLIGTLCIYTVLFLSGALPFFLGKINDLLHLSYATDDKSSIYLLFTLDLILLLFIVYRFKRKSISFEINWLALLRLLGAIVLVASGGWLAVKNYPMNWKLDPTTLYYFPLLTILIVTLWIYDHFGRNNKFGGNRFTLQNGLFLVILSTSACISFYTCFSALIVWGLLFVLFENPLRFKEIPVLAALFQAGVSVGFLFVGFLTFGAPLIGFPTLLLFLVLVISFSIHLSIEYLQKPKRINF
jgi:hypothetical protein